MSERFLGAVSRLLQEAFFAVAFGHDDETHQLTGCMLALCGAKSSVSRLKQQYAAQILPVDLACKAHCFLSSERTLQ